MHWTRVSLLCLCVTTFALSRTASAQVGQVTDSSGVVRLDDFSGAMSLANDGGSYFLFDNVAGDGVGIRSGYSRFGLRGKLLDFGESHLFTEINGLITNQSRLGVNLGAGYRTMVGDGMLGASGWFDRYESNYGNLYSQFSVGAEYLHQWLDLRANGYMPFGNREHFTRVLSAGTDPIFSGNTLGTVGVAQMERSLSGFDFEGGVPLPVANWIRMYGGGYFLTAKGDDTWGVKSRVEARVGQGASVNFLVTNDDRFGTNLNLQVQLMFGRGRLPTSFSPDVSGYARRYDPVRRTPYVQLAYDHVRSVVPLINTETGNPFDLVWVDNTATAPGDGTIEHPFHDLPNNAPGADHILVRTGVGNTTGNITLQNNQHLWGEGRTYVLHTDRLGDFTIPDNIFKQTGPAPTLVAANGGQPVVTLANNNDVVNFNINGGTFGVFGQNITNFNLDSLVVNAANSLVIDNAHGVGNILNSSFAAQAAGTAAFISNTSPGRLDLTMTSVATSGGLDGLVVHAQDGGLIQANIDGFVGDRHAGTGMILSSDNGTLLANVTDAHILNSGGLAGSGFELRAQNAGQLGVSMNNVSARGNANGLVMNADTAHLNASVVGGDFSDMAAGSGVVINASNAVVSTQFTNLTASNNGTDGFRIGAANGAIVASSIVDSNLNGNTDDNVQANVISGAKVNLFVDTVDAADSQTGNGFEFLVSDVGSNLNAAFVDTDLARSGLNAVSGLVTNGGTARVDMLNIQASDAAFNGMALTVSDGANFTSVIRDSTFTRSGLLNNGVGLSLDMSNGSTALLDLGNTPFNANGARGFDFAVTGGALGGSTLNALLTDGNFSDNALSNVSGAVDGAGSVANLQLTDTTADNLGSQGGVNLAVTNGGNMNVNWDGSASSISGTTSDGVILTATNPNSVLNFNFSDGRIRDNAEDGVNAAIVSGGAGTILNIALNDATVINNGFNGVEFATAGAGAAGRLELNNTPLSNNGRSGLLFNSTTGSSLTILGAGGDFSNNGLQGINGTASGAGTLVGMDLTGATASQNNLEGILLNSTTGASLAAILNGATANLNGNENLRASAVTGGQLQIASTLSDFSNGGVNGAFDNVKISSTDAGSLATVFMDGVLLNNSTLNGLELTATNNGSLNADLRSQTGILESSNNLNGFGMLLTATNADQFIVTGVGPSRFNFNGLGGVSANVQTANVGVVGISGSALFNGGDGVNIQMDNVAAGAIAVRGPGDIIANIGDGIEIDVSNTTLVNVAANGQTINGLEIQDENIEGNTGDAINVHFDNVTMNSAGVISGNTINGQQNGIIVDMTNNSTSDLSISNNTISDVAQLGISVTADSGNPHNIKIDNNTVLRSGASNINVAFSGNTTVVDNLVIFQNTVDGGGITAGDGIGVNIVDATVLLTDVNNNTSSNNQGNGINIDVSGAAVMGPVVAIGNTTNGNGADGMRYNQSAGTSLTNLTMDFNNADANGGNGMNVVLNNVAGDPDIDLSGNTVSNSALQGISLVANDTSLEDIRASQNVVTNSNGGDGIHIEMNNPGGAATNFSIVSSGNQVSGSLGTGINIALDGLDTTATKPTILLDDNTITDNLGLGVAVSALDMSINNLLVTDSTVTGNSGGDGIFLNLNSTTTQTANRVEIDGTTSSNNGGNGATVAISNVNIGQFVMDGSTMNGNAGGGLAYLGTDSSSLLLAVNNSTVTGNAGGDGVLLSLINSPSSAVQLNGNSITNNAGNGINVDADGSAIGDMTISGNASISVNAADGIRLALANGSNLGGLTIDGNTLNANATNGIEFLITDSTLPGPANPAIISNNLITGHATGNGIQLVTPDTNGSDIGMNFIGNTITGNVIGVNTQFNNNAGEFVSVSSDNNISGNSSFGFRLVSDEASTFDVTFNGGSFSDNHDAGVGVTMNGTSQGRLGVRVATITGNTNGADADFNGDGIHVRVLQDATLLGTSFFNLNTVANNTATGFDFDIQQNAFIGGGLTIDGNEFTNTGDAIRFTRLASGEVGGLGGAVQITNNTITGGADGIELIARNAPNFDSYVLNNNTITNVGGRGIVIEHGFNAHMIVDMDTNTITGSAGDGIQVFDTAGTLANESRSLDGLWQNLTVNNNGGNGMSLGGALGGFAPLEIETSTINNNAGLGVSVTGPGELDFHNNNVENNGAGGIAVTGPGFKSMSFDSNQISSNAGDGIRVVNNGNNGGFSFDIGITNNTIEFNTARGINILNQGNADTDLNISGNFVNANAREGVFIMNTSSTTQSADFGSALQADGAVNVVPRIFLTANNNVVIGNGNAGTSVATGGFVLRVGTSDNRDGAGFINDPGGFATVGGRGGVVANMDGNNFNGNAGNDVYFDSFTSTVAPATTAGQWTDQNENPRNGANDVFQVDSYATDPLARLTLNFTNNQLQDGALTNVGASYNNAEAVFKSRTQAQDNNTDAPPDDDGPFGSGTRARNAQRLAFRGNLPPDLVIGNSDNFLFPGVGQSTFRVHATGNSGFSGTGFIFDNAPYVSPQGSANGLPPGTPNGGPLGIDNMPYGWTSF